MLYFLFTIYYNLYITFNLLFTKNNHLFVIFKINYFLLNFRKEILCKYSQLGSCFDEFNSAIKFLFECSVQYIQFFSFKFACIWSVIITFILICMHTLIISPFKLTIHNRNNESMHRPNKQQKYISGSIDDACADVWGDKSRTYHLKRQLVAPMFSTLSNYYQPDKSISQSPPRYISQF